MITSDEETTTLITTTMIQELRISLVKLLQQKNSFKEEYKWLKLMEGKDIDSRRLNKNCRMSQQDPFIDESDVIRVGRRLQTSHIIDDCQHQIQLPKKGKVSVPDH